MNPIALIKIDPLAPEMDEVYGLRPIAWRTEANVHAEMENWRDEIDSVAHHWVVVVDGRVVAAARLSVHEILNSSVPDASVYLDGFEEFISKPFASMNRLVVHPDFRRQGFGTLLTNVRIEYATEVGCKSILASSSNPKRIATLERHGFQVVGKGSQNPHQVYRDRGRQTVLIYDVDQP